MRRVDTSLDIQRDCRYEVEKPGHDDTADARQSVWQRATRMFNTVAGRSSRSLRYDNMKFGLPVVPKPSPSFRRRRLRPAEEFDTAHANDKSERTVVTDRTGFEVCLILLSAPPWLLTCPQVTPSSFITEMLYQDNDIGDAYNVYAFLLFPAHFY